MVTGAHGRRPAPAGARGAGDILGLSLGPKTGEFYSLFARAGANLHETARSAEIRFREFPGSSVGQAEIKELEHEGDRILHDLLQHLNEQFVVPYDREDAFRIANAVDDVVDSIDDACELLGLYGVDGPTEYALDQCRVLVEASERLAVSLAALKTLRGVEAQLLEVKRLEDEGDRIRRDAIRALFRDPAADPLVVVRWKGIYEQLEEAIDGCDTVANLIGNLVVKHR